MPLVSVKSAVRITLIAATALSMSQAFAHTGAHHAAASFSGGFAHPLFGLDHLLAMLAVGLWASQNQRPALWVLPLVFPLMMALGAVLGVAGIGFPVVEAGIAGSVAVLGVLIAFAIRMPTWASAALVSLFALAHGHAHGTELPPGGSALLYGAGFVAATALLHLLGLAAGLLANKQLAASMVRVAGAGIAAAGVYFLAGVA